MTSIVYEKTIELGNLYRFQCLYNSKNNQYETRIFNVQRKLSNIDSSFCGKEYTLKDTHQLEV